MAFKKASTIRFNLSGFDGVEAVLRLAGANHGDTIERRLSRAALGAGLTQAAKLIRQGAPKKSGLKKAVGTRIARDRRKNEHTAKAGLNVGKKNGSAPHAHFFTLGTDLRATRRGLNRGRVKENRFVIQAINLGHPSISQAMIKRIQARLPIEIERIHRKHGKTQGQGYWSRKVANVQMGTAVQGLPDHG